MGTSWSLGVRTIAWTVAVLLLAVLLSRLGPPPQDEVPRAFDPISATTPAVCAVTTSGAVGEGRVGYALTEDATGEPCWEQRTGE